MNTTKTLYISQIDTAIINELFAPIYFFWSLGPTGILIFPCLQSCPKQYCIIDEA